MPCHQVFSGRLAALVVLAALVFGWAGAARAFEVRETFEVGDWSGQAQYVDGGKRFDVCLVWADYDTGRTLAFMRKDDGFSVIISDAGAQLEQYSLYPLTLTIDRLWSEHLTSRAVLHSLVVEFGQDARVWDAFRRGRLLTVVNVTHRFVMSLKGSARALTRLERCYREHSPAAARSEHEPAASLENPFATPTAQARRDGPSMQLDQLKGLFRKVVGAEFWVKPDEKTSVDYFYGVGDLLKGGYWENYANGRSTETILSEILAFLQKNCSGRVESILSAKVDSKRAQRQHLSFACKDDDDFYFVTVVLWKNGYFSAFLNLTDMANAKVAEEIGTAVGTALAP